MDGHQEARSISCNGYITSIHSRGVADVHLPVPLLLAPSASAGVEYTFWLILLAQPLPLSFNAPDSPGLSHAVLYPATLFSRLPLNRSAANMHLHRAGITALAVGVQLGAAIPTSSPRSSSPSYSPNATRANAVKAAFQHAWDGYYAYAFPHDSLLPVTNSYQDDR